MHPRIQKEVDAYFQSMGGKFKGWAVIVILGIFVLGAIAGPQYGESNSPKSTTVQSPPVNQTPTDITNSFQSCRTMSTQAFAQCQQQSSTPVAKEGCTSTLKWSLDNCQRRYECEMYKRC